MGPHEWTDEDFRKIVNTGDEEARCLGSQDHDKDCPQQYFVTGRVNRITDPGQEQAAQDVKEGSGNLRTDISECHIR
jgi:hypothetical protein